MQVALVTGSIETFINMSEMGDPVEEQKRLAKDLTEIQDQIDRLKTLLSSDFGKKAPEKVIAKEKLRLTEFQQQADKILIQIKSYKN